MQVNPYENNFENLYCILPVGSPHLVLEPVRLSCEHFVCKNCINEKGLIKIRCTRKDCLRLSVLNNAFAIDNTLPYTNEIIQKLFQDSLSEIEDLICKKEEEINGSLKYSEDEILVRTESLKINLDSIMIECSAMISSSKDSIIRDASVYSDHNDLDTLTKQIEMGEEVRLGSYCLKLGAMQSYLKCMDTDVKLVVNGKSKIKDEIIANTWFGITERITQEMIERHTFLTLPRQFDAIYFLPNDTIALSSCVRMKEGITLCDQNFKISKKINTINGKLVKPTFIIFSKDKDKIYVCEDDKIMMTDMNFVLIKEIEWPKQNNMQIKCIQIYKQYLFVLDGHNFRIHVLTDDLQKKGLITMKCQPSSVLIQNDLLMTSNMDRIYFKEIQSNLNLKLSLKYEVKESLKELSFINDHFYAYVKLTHDLHCFNKKGYSFNAYGSMYQTMRPNLFTIMIRQVYFIMKKLENCICSLEKKDY